VAAEPDDVDVWVVVDLHKDLVKDIIDLQGQPGQCEEGHHQHQHLYHLLLVVHDRNIPLKLSSTGGFGAPEGNSHPDISSTDEYKWYKVLDKAEKILIPHEVLNFNINRNALQQVRGNKLCSECYGHWHCQDGAHNPYDQDDHLCAGLGGVAFQREHDGFISVNSYGSECKNTGIYTQILKERTEGTEKLWQVPPLKQSCLKLEGDGEQPDYNICQRQVGYEEVGH